MCQNKCQCPLCPFNRLKILPKYQIHYVEALYWVNKYSKFNEQFLKCFTKIDSIYIEDINNFFRYGETTVEQINGLFALIEKIGKFFIYIILIPNYICIIVIKEYYNNYDIIIITILFNF